MATAVSQYNEYYETCLNPPLYSAPWWLDATCGKDGWDVFTFQNEYGQFVAVIPYCNTRIRGLRAVINPPLTQWLPILGETESIPHLLDAFIQSCFVYPILDVAVKPHTHVNAEELPFQYKIRYSYILRNTGNNFQARSGYNEGLKRNLREAEKLYTIQSSYDISTFLALCHSSFHQQKIKAPSWLDRIVPALFHSLHKNNRGQIDLAYLDNKPVAGILTAFDHSTSYYLTGGKGDMEQGASAHALLLDHAIEKAMEKGLDFDFEGSMQPGIANFFQSFGAVPEPYWHIRKFRGAGKLWSLFHP